MRRQRRLGALPRGSLSLHGPQCSPRSVSPRKSLLAHGPRWAGAKLVSGLARLSQPFLQLRIPASRAPATQ